MRFKVYPTGMNLFFAMSFIPMFVFDNDLRSFAYHRGPSELQLASIHILLGVVPLQQLFGGVNAL